MKRFLSTHAPTAVLIIRIMVGAVFVSEGMQKFLLPADVGAGRFAKIGFPSPEIVAPFVGSFEIACGVLVLIGLFTRFAAIPLLIVMITAIATTKVPILSFCSHCSTEYLESIFRYFTTFAVAARSCC